MSRVSEWQHLKMSFDEIKVATENFTKPIGRGGYGWVYKGKLLVSGKETIVAVKRLNEQFGQGLKEFSTEIQLLSRQKHPNLISLVGYCDEGKEKTIVYEYAERGSLDQYIRRSGKTTSTTLTWLQRLKICADAARGLDHLHRHVGGDQTIIHRDIKSSNILIDENWVAKISDLGLSKLSITTGNDIGLLITNGCGTQGYCEQEYFNTRILSLKSDVYSFGVVLFEVLCGRLCLIVGDDGFLLTSKSAKYHYEKKSLDKIMDDSLREHIGSYSMTKFSEIAYRCLHDDREQRPAMDVVLKELEEALKYQEDANGEYWETKLPRGLDSLIKMFKIPYVVYTNKKKQFSNRLKGIYFGEGNKEGDTDEYWETKLPEDLDSSIKMFKIPREVYANTKELFMQMTSIGIVLIMFLYKILVLIGFFAVIDAIVESSPLAGEYNIIVVKILLCMFTVVLVVSWL